MLHCLTISDYAGNWRNQPPELEKLMIKRCFKPDDFGTFMSVQLHLHFSDASTIGYGQCSYIRLVNKNGDIHVSLACAKVRVAPVKQVTKPRLELIAAVLATKVSRFLQKKLIYDPVEEFYWTDSEVVLAYVSSDAKRFHVFVANTEYRRFAITVLQTNGGTSRAY